MAKFLVSHFWISFILSAIIMFLVVKIKKNGLIFNVMHASASNAGRLGRFLLLDLAYGVLIFILLLLSGILYDSIAKPIKIGNARAAMVSIQNNLEQYWEAGIVPENPEATSPRTPAEQVGDTGEYSVPKVLIISKNENREEHCHIDDLQFELPKEMIPKTDKDVEYIAKISWFFMRYGEFANGDTVSSTCAHIAIVNASSNQIIAQSDIYGDEPNVTRRAGAAGSVTGPIPEEKIILYIRQAVLIQIWGVD